MFELIKGHCVPKRDVVASAAACAMPSRGDA